MGGPSKLTPDCHPRDWNTFNFFLGHLFNFVHKIVKGSQSI